MKINSIKNDFTLKQGYLEPYRNPHSAKEKNAGLCEKNTRKYNVAFNGSLPVNCGAAVNGINSRKMKALNWLLEFVKKHNVSGNALMALFLAGALRPVTIMALPGDKDKEDKIYAAGHSMASGLIGYAFSTAVTTPWDNGIEELMENYKKHYDVVIDNIRNGKNAEPPALKYKFDILTKKYDKLVELEKQAADSGTKLAKKACKQYIDALQLEMKNISEWVIALPRAALTIALIPLILKYVFGLEKKKPAQAQAQTPVNGNNDKAVVDNKELNKIKNLTGQISMKSFTEHKGGQQ